MQFNPISNLDHKSPMLFISKKKQSSNAYLLPLPHHGAFPGDHIGTLI